jgi:cytochrome P450
MTEIHYDPALEATRDDPYPVYALLRAADPVHWNPPGFWFVTRYDDVRPLLRDPRLGVDKAASDDARVEGQEKVRPGVSTSLVMTNPPDHTRLRGLVSQAFAPRAVAYLQERIEAVTARLLADCPEPGGAQFDLMAQYARPLPVQIICEMLGVPEADRAALAAAVDDFAYIAEPVLAPETAARAFRGSDALKEYFAALIAERRGAPGGDILSALMEAEEDGDKLTMPELLANMAVLALAGYETTANLLCHCVLGLLRHPDQLAALRRDPDRIPAAVEETLRYDPPAQSVARRALDDIEVGGRLIRRGERVVLSLGAANRDPARFAEPDRFDLDRADDRHLAFGGGIHFCLGAYLGRLEVSIALRRLLEAYPRLELAAQPRWQARAGLRGPRELLLTSAPASQRALTAPGAR